MDYIRSDRSGQITAQVMENVYDSPTGSLLVISQGTVIERDHTYHRIVSAGRPLLTLYVSTFGNGHLF